MIDVFIPDQRSAEHKYILDVILGDFLGLDYVTRSHSGKTIEITGSNGQATLKFTSSFLTMPQSEWLLPESTHHPSLAWLDTSVQEAMEAWLHHAELLSLSELLPNTQPSAVDIDVFGICFYYLTRYEEVAGYEPDEHGRFSFEAALPRSKSFAMIPVVNLLTEYLWERLVGIDPGLQRNRRVFRALVSHDVDVPWWFPGTSLQRLIKSLAADLLRRKDASLALRRAYSWIRKDDGRDPNNTFDYIMDVCAGSGLSSAWYFLTDSSDPMNANYSLDEPRVDRLFQSLRSRGQEVGLHGGYETYLSAERLEKESSRLRSLPGMESEFGGRQHYLRWKAPDTWRNYEEAGLIYDTSVGWADHVGFRAGCCFEYQVWDVLAGQRLNITERPLIVMEASLFASCSYQYMALSDQVGLQIYEQLLNHTRKVNGDFTLLWHNSSLITRAQRALFEQCVTLLASQTP